MPTDTGTLNLAWARLIMQALVDQGVTHVFVSPGSRSTPLVLAAALTPEIRTIVHIDERGAAFAAQGFGRTGRPAALVCTSGTAAANYYPAIIEASMAGVPLIVLTADRPPELRGTGANQTIDQVNLYGDYVRYFHDLQCPDPDYWIGDLGYIVTMAMLKAMGKPHGPAHINCQFREPLAPAVVPQTLSVEEATACFRGAPFAEPRDGVFGGEADPTVVSELTDALLQAKRPLVVVGQGMYSQWVFPRFRHHFPTVPVVTDITSGLRQASADHFCEHIDLLCASPRFLAELEPDLVLHIGGRMTSKRLSQALGAWPCTYWRVTHTCEPPPDNPAHRSMKLARLADFTACTEALVAESYRHRTTGRDERLSAYSREFTICLDRLPPYNTHLTEIAVCRHIADQLSAHNMLYLSASLPIRLFDSFVGDWPGCTQQDDIDLDLIGPPFVAANRGASGIDGVVSSACGLAQATYGPATLVIGDIAMLHDLNGLALARQLETPLVIVVLNNDGGGIFEMLPIRESAPEQFETFFGTPHGMNFMHAAAQFGIPYAQPENLADFAEAYQTARLRPGPTLIEVRTDRRQTAELLRDAVSLARHVCGDRD